MQDLLDRFDQVARDLAPGVAALAILGLAVWLVYHGLRFILHGFVVRAGEPLAEEGRAGGAERELQTGERRKRLATLETSVLRALRWIAITIVALGGVQLLVPSLAQTVGTLGIGLLVALGGAIGFGAQQVVRDYLNGALILAENPFSHGDVVAIAGIHGTVELISLRRTLVRDADGALHSVPNGQIAVATNFTRTFARVNERIVVAYADDVERATELANDIGHQLGDDPDWSSRITEAPGVAAIDAIADSGISILIVGTVRPGEQWAVGAELRRRLIAAFNAAGIELASSRRLILARPAHTSQGDEDLGTRFE